MRVATLTLLDRLVVALHRGGAGPITIVAEEPPAGLKRATALGIPFQVVQDPPRREAPTLVATSNVLLRAAEVRELLRHGGRLADGNGSPLPIGVVPAGETPWELGLQNLPVHPTSGIARCVFDAASAREAQKSLWASLTSSADGLVDRFFNRPCGRVLSKLLAHTPVHPNVVSLISVAIGLLAAGFFAVGTYSAIVMAAILFQVSAIVDCVDGDLARILFKESPFGKWLDLAGDQVVHIAVFAGIALGLVRTGQSPVALWLGISAVFGAVLSFAVVVRGMKQVSNENGLLQKLIDSTTNRDFSVLVLALACCDRLEWFLWLTAIGSHLFWLTTLALQLNAATGTAQSRAR